MHFRTREKPIFSKHAEQLDLKSSDKSVTSLPITRNQLAILTIPGRLKTVPAVKSFETATTNEDFHIESIYKTVIARDRLRFQLNVQQA
jgi:hypothetical protein